MNTAFLASDGRRRKLMQKQRGGAWYVRATHNGRNVWRSTETNELPAAKVKAIKLFDEIVSGQVIESDASFDKLVERFLDSRQVKAKHTRDNDSAFANTLRSSFPMRTAARNVRTGDILGWLNKQATSRKWKARTFNHYRLWLKQIFDLAVADRLITRDEHPFIGRLIKRQRLDRVVRNIPTADQFAAIVADELRRLPVR